MTDMAFTCTRCGSVTLVDEQLAIDTPVARGETDFVCPNCLIPAERDERQRIAQEAMTEVVRRVMKPEQN